MTICKNCKKKTLFVNARYLCEECANLSITSPNSSITIGFYEPPTKNRSVGHSDEEDVCNFFIQELVRRGKSLEKFKIEHRSDDYTSLMYGFSNILRVKVTSNVKWLSICLGNDDRKKYINSPLFANQHNKNEGHWISYFDNNEDLNKYIDILDNASIYDFYGTRKELTSKEKEVADFIIKLFIECGADINEFYLYILANEFSLLYHSNHGSIRIKKHAKRSGGYIVDSCFKECRINSKNNKYVFSKLDDLILLKKKYIPLKIEKGLSYSDKDNMQYYIKYNNYQDTWET